MDEVTVVEASLTVVLDITHPPGDLETASKTGHSTAALAACVGAQSCHVGRNKDAKKREMNICALELSGVLSPAHGNTPTLTHVVRPRRRAWAASTRAHTRQHTIHARQRTRTWRKIRPFVSHRRAAHR